jgi:hypothetical protein
MNDPERDIRQLQAELEEIGEPRGRWERERRAAILHKIRRLEFQAAQMALPIDK